MVTIKWLQHDTEDSLASNNMVSNIIHNKQDTRRITNQESDAECRGGDLLHWKEKNIVS